MPLTAPIAVVSLVPSLVGGTVSGQSILAFLLSLSLIYLFFRLHQR
jgi:hypothetical protein